MSDSTALEGAQKFLITQAPVLLVSIGGLLITLRLWRRAPAASLWAAAAFALGILTCALMGVAQAVGSGVASFLGPVLRAAAWVLLLIAVYAGRPCPAADSPETLWQRAGAAVRARPGLATVASVLFSGVFLLTVLTSTLVTFILPESFVSKARIDLRGGQQEGLQPASIKTQCEVMQSELVLGKVIEDLDLNRQWGKKYASGERLKTSESLGLLQARLDVRPVPATSIIEIASYSESPVEAAKIANAIAEAYREYANPPVSAAPTSAAYSVQIIDRAVPAIRPIRPDKLLNISLGVLMGLVLGLVVAGGVWWAGLAVRLRH
jgi:hypothetical protein